MRVCHPALILTGMQLQSRCTYRLSFRPKWPCSCATQNTINLQELVMPFAPTGSCKHKVHSLDASSSARVPWAQRAMLVCYPEVTLYLPLLPSRFAPGGSCKHRIQTLRAPNSASLPWAQEAMLVCYLHVRFISGYFSRNSRQETAATVGVCIHTFSASTRARVPLRPRP